MEKIDAFHKSAALLLLAAGLLGANGCASYRLGSMLPPGVNSVYVPTFENKTDQPQIEFETTQATVNELLADGSLKVETEQNADSILMVTLTDYSLSPISFERDRRTAAEEYRVFLTADVKLINARENEIIFQEPNIRGESTFLLETDITTGKRLALPLAANDLAHDIVERIVEYW